MQYKTSVSISAFESNRMTDEELIATHKNDLKVRLLRDIEKDIKYRIYFSPEEKMIVINASVNIGGTDD